MNDPRHDGASTVGLWSIDATLDGFNREDMPPENVPLRILLDDGLKEYSPPWPYEFRDGDFFAIKTGLAPHKSIAVCGWALWK